MIDEQIMKKLLLVAILSLFVSPSLAPAFGTNAPADASHPTVSSSCTDLNKNMGYRARDVSTSGEVSVLQKFLNIKGYLVAEPTGFLGLATVGAIKKFQSASSLPSTGYVGQLTRAKIKLVSCIVSTAIPIAVFTPIASSAPIQLNIATTALLYEKLKATLPANVGAGLPVRLKIPAINVDAVVEYVGLTPEGAMDTPRGPDNAGWYNLGPRPGEVGSSVVAGHSGWKNNIPAVFDNLHKMKIGDKIYIEDDRGMITNFVVREIRKFDPNADASDVFDSKDGKVHINLITCEGTWDKVSRSSSQRLVVFADKE